MATHASLHGRDGHVSHRLLFGAPYEDTSEESDQIFGVYHRIRAVRRHSYANCVDEPIVPKFVRTRNLVGIIGTKEHGF